MKFSIFGDYRYFSLQEEICAFNANELISAFVKLEKLKEDFFCVGFVSYEAYKAWSNTTFCSSFPLLYFQVFTQREEIQIPKTKHCFFPLKGQFINQEAYVQKVNFLKEQIALGNTYQGNFTTFYDFESTLESLDIFYVLLGVQNTAYKAFLPTPFGDILSFSPELFFQIKQDQILCKPMKGTMPRGKTPQEDEKNKQFLASDLKNKSENVMIVDLLRNDLSKIVQNGTLEVSKLFEVETYPTLFQMTSSIQGKLKDNQTLLEIFQALFPCGSITGAPKKITTEILQSLEEQDRGVYCGAIGMLQKDEMTFSIPIRTIFKQGKKCHYGVGSGIVWDSQAKEEYQELQTKMSFLKSCCEFSLLETILFTPKEIEQEFLTLPKGFVFLSHHLQRLQNSAKALGFAYPKDILHLLQSLDLKEETIIRLLLSKEGELSLQTIPFEKTQSNQICIQEKEFLSDLASFKTTLEKDLTFLRQNQLFDVIYHRNGILLEGMRSNLVLELEEGLFTPQYEGEFLCGVCRSVLLESGVIKERVLNLSDLKRARRIFCTNSVRGMMEVNLV